MPRYIDLEAFAERIKKYIKPESEEEKELLDWCKDECIRQGYCMPTADAVEVVRCKDCKNWVEASFDPITESNWGYCRYPLGEYRYSLTEEIDYCSYGERKE